MARTKTIAGWGNEHGLNATTLKRMQIRRVTKGEAAKLLGYPVPAGGFLIPYFDLDGKPISFFRIRFDDHHDPWETTLKAKPTRYRQAAGSAVYAYFAPIAQNSRKVAQDASVSLIITEGEAKAAKACQDGFPTIGLGGVESWRGTLAGSPLLRELHQFEWQGREVAIAYDSDATNNPNVMRAENALAGALVNQGARVKVIRLPAGDDGRKVGLDDYLIAKSPDALRILITETQEWALSREIHELSARYGYIHEISQVIEYPTPERPRPLLFAPETFMRCCEVARKITIEIAAGDGCKRKTVSAARYWFESEARPTYPTLTYEPGQPSITVGNKFNTWQPSNVSPAEGDTQPWKELIAHLVPDAAEREWFECWIAAPLQQPGLRANSAAVMWGEREGTGKTLIGSTIGALHGAGNWAEITQTELQSSFNDWQAEKTFIMGSELCGEKDSRAVADRLKTIITGETVTVNKKHQPAYTLPNHANFYLTSNHPNAVFMGDHARRFAVFHVHSAPLPAQFYSDFVRWRDNGGLPALLHRLLKKDLSNFNAKGHAIKTSAREDMIEASRGELATWLHQLREDPDSVEIDPYSPLKKVHSLHTVDELLSMFDGTKGRYTRKGMATALRQEGFRR